jgi:hypothetical protein
MELDMTFNYITKEIPGARMCEFYVGTDFREYYELHGTKEQLVEQAWKLIEDRYRRLHRMGIKAKYPRLEITSLGCTYMSVIVDFDQKLLVER